jgi:hypothetical protein
LRYVGKEPDRRWSKGEDLSIFTFAANEFAPSGKLVVDPALIDEITHSGMRELMRKTGLSQHTIEAIRAGKTVRRATLQRVVQFLTERRVKKCHTRTQN